MLRAAIREAQGMNTKPATWVLVANRANARIFEKLSLTKIRLVKTLEHPEGRRKDREVDSDRPGRSFARAGAARHAFSRDEEPAEHHANVFAKQLAGEMDGLVRDHHPREVVLIAEPKFLGQIKSHMAENTTRITKTISKELVSESEHELLEHLDSLS